MMSRRIYGWVGFWIRVIERLGIRLSMYVANSVLGHYFILVFGCLLRDGFNGGICRGYLERIFVPEL